MTKKMMAKLAAAGFFVALIALSYLWQASTPPPQIALAQSGSVDNHAVPIGRGVGVTGFGSADPGSAGLALMSNGPSADPSFQSLPTAPVLPNHSVMLGTGTSSPGSTGPGTAGFVLTANGASADPTMQSLPFASGAQYLAGVSASTVIPPSIIYQAEVPVTYGTTTSFDFSTFLNAAVTLTGNITTMNVSNVKAGQAGTITFIQDSTGSRTVALNSVFKFSGSAPTFSTAANAVDVLSYSCRSATFCVASLLTNVH